MVEDYNREIEVQKRAINTLCKPYILSNFIYYLNKNLNCCKFYF